jgi:hypothetical protein
MKIRLTLNFRKFNDHDERRDSGYYEGLDEKKRGLIEINRNDDEFEQILTVYHEITHAIVELLLKFGIDKNNQHIIKKPKDVKMLWDELNDKAESKNGISIEERLCRKVEKVVEKVFDDIIPSELRNKMLVRHSKKKRKKKRICTE